MATERPEGLEKNAVLSMWDDKIIDDFVANYKRYRYEPNFAINDQSPSDIIISSLIEN